MGIMEWAKFHKELKMVEKEAEKTAKEETKRQERIMKLEEARLRGIRKGEIKGKGIKARALDIGESAKVAGKLFAKGAERLGKYGETMIASQEEMEKQYQREMKRFAVTPKRKYRSRRR